jgi:uncharacterized membrane protein (UPF0127 family)
MNYQLKHQGKVIAERIESGDSFLERLCGLMFSKNIGNKDGLIFESKSLHTHFMRYDLDIIFLNADYNIIKIIRAMKPWRMTGLYWEAKYAIEMSAGVLTMDINVGDKMELVCIN